MFYKINIKTIVHIICAVALSLNILTGQQNVLGTLPLVQTGDTTPTSPKNNLVNSDYERINIIYNKLVKARGDFRYPVPKLFLRNENSRVASIDYDNLEIVVEEKAYKTCVPYGDEALAFLLGHELTHYYEKHAWKSDFASDNRDLEVGQNLKINQDQVANETQADYLGGFLAYSAGYGMFEKSGDIIRQLYTEYKLPDQLKGYPSLQDRIELAKRSTHKLESLIDVFDMANLLSAIGKYTEAYQYYSYILMHYQSREIYNNLGVISILDAIKYFNPKELKYQYVVELDLKSLVSRGDEDPKQIRDSLLHQAIRHFDAAIGMDPKYAPGYLNKATALALLEDTIRAQFYASDEAYEMAVKNNFPKTAIDAQILLGILHARAGDTKEAQTLFEKAAESGSELAKTNLAILNEWPVNKQLKSSFDIPLAAMDNNDLHSFSKNPQFKTDKVIRLNHDFTFYQYTEDSLSFRVLYNLNNDLKILDYFMITKPDSKARTNKGIGIGSGKQEIETSYGTPMQTIETPQGNIMVYDKMLFIIGQDQKVIKWSSYLSKKSML